MGIRQNLAVGYGLDLNILGGADRAALAYGHLEDKVAFLRYREDVFAWATERDEFMEKLVFHDNMNPAYDFADMTVYDSEFGLEDKLLLIPSGQKKSWRRYGDLLDAFVYEAQMDYENPNWMESQWQQKPGTLYPYVGLMRANPEQPLGVEKYWTPCYMDRPELRDSIPWAPWHLWFLIKHLGLWSEDKTTEAFLSLRPTIYRHWS